MGFRRHCGAQFKSFRRYELSSSTVLMTNAAPGNDMLAPVVDKIHTLMFMISNVGGVYTLNVSGALVVKRDGGKEFVRAVLIFYK